MLQLLKKLNLFSTPRYSSRSSGYKFEFPLKAVNAMSSMNRTMLHRIKIVKIEKRSLQFRCNPLLHPYKPRLSDVFLPSPMWRLFYRQNEAFEFAATQENSKVFSVESAKEPKSGARSYIVASLEEFWNSYKQIQTGKRHFYELIPVDAYCHMYFDLEFNKSVNFECDGDAMVDLWISYVNFCLKKEFNIDSDRKHVIELDSTTDIKFSQHLIWHVPKAVFKNNNEVGNFVHYICDSIQSYMDLKKENSPLLLRHWLHSSSFAKALDIFYVSSSSSEKTLFVDEGVYTKNRNFRLYLSSKKGKATELTLSPHCRFDFSPVDLRFTCCSHHAETLKFDPNYSREKEKLIFFSSLITNIHMRDDIKVLEMPAEKCKEKRSGSVMQKITYSKNVSRFDPKQFPLDDKISPEHFLQLLEFVTKYVQKFNENAYVSKVNLNRLSHQSIGSLFFDIAGTRYCRTIQREHKSNGIFIVVDLDNQLWYHRCFDHECRMSSNKPKPVRLPLNLSTYSQEITRGFAHDDINDSELLHEVELFERDAKK